MGTVERYRLCVAPGLYWPRPPRNSGPSPLGPGGAPLVPALTHSTSGAVTGSNARLGTSKDLSSGHETPYRHFRADDIRTTPPSTAAQITAAATRIQPRPFHPKWIVRRSRRDREVHAGDSDQTGPSGV